ncbi:hypothetical protein GCM10009804_29580 [Kribbella hippodromi]|uniref:SecDF P1 head subdomain domain-containing protein n=1 Tax=Kribbella hippodromi TaxID=434347 RepID=A0ABN2D8Q3_9ACTN
MTQPPVPPNDSNNPQDQPRFPNQPPPPQGQPPYPAGQPPYQPGQPPHPSGQPPYQPGQPPYQPGNAPFQPGFQGQQPYAPVPRKVSRGSLVLVITLGVVMLALVATGVIIALTRDKKPSTSSAPPSAAASKPSDPTAVEFRRVIAVKPGTCPTPAPDGTACDEKGNRYTLGKVELNGSNVDGVKVGLQEGSTTGAWAISLTLDAEGAKLFGRLTAGLAKQDPPANQLAILVRGQVVTAPTVMSEIPGGKVEITGTYTRDDAEKVAGKIIG